MNDQSSLGRLRVGSPEGPGQSQPHHSTFCSPEAAPKGPARDGTIRWGSALSWDTLRYWLHRALQMHHVEQKHHSSLFSAKVHSQELASWTQNYFLLRLPHSLLSPNCCSCKTVVTITCLCIRAVTVTWVCSTQVITAQPLKSRPQWPSGPEGSVAI